ncbi:hypothetical protein NtB2_01500 [Lactococcus termiticola]|uniref:Uncharacterized protein n=1 Tax=Lactococcus termiticola TaxID=2169526 RepID=A0A2R5HKH5_9LACT|nr:hypothetical protein NtB2_01500 [Lactococcus termiticola]
MHLNQEIIWSLQLVLASAVAMRLALSGATASKKRA